MNSVLKARHDTSRRPSSTDYLVVIRFFHFYSAFARQVPRYTLAKLKVSKTLQVTREPWLVISDNTCLLFLGRHVNHSAAVVDVLALFDGVIHEKADAPPTGLFDVRGVLDTLRTSRFVGPVLLSSAPIEVLLASHRTVLPVPPSAIVWLLRRSSPLLLGAGAGS
jgi:hypothetical protein